MEEEVGLVVESVNSYLLDLDRGLCRLPTNESATKVPVSCQGTEPPSCFGVVGSLHTPGHPGTHPVSLTHTRSP